MRKTILIVFLLSILATGVKFVYDEITKLKSELLSLNNVKMKLNRENANLKNRNGVLTKKQKLIQDRIRDRRVSVAQKKLNRAKEKLAKASVGAIPFVGTAAVLTLTYSEIEDYCKDIKEYKQFEQSLFNTFDNTISDEEKVLCGYDYETVKGIVFKDLEKYKNKSADWIKNQYD